MIRPLKRALLLVLLLFCAASPAVAGSDDGAAVWFSSADGTRRLERQADIVPSPVAPGPETTAITLDPSRRFQTITGFGAAMTDASAHLIMTHKNRETVLQDLFGPTGLHLSFVRVPIGASDFSASHYSFDDMPAGTTDPGLKHFSLAAAQAEQIPALREARKVNPNLTLMASPWSAPAWMKDSGSLIGGRLKPEAYPAFARYLQLYLAGMASNGIPVQYLSVQNEPDFEPANYPGMRFDPGARARFIGSHLGPVLRGKLKVLDWDHNWDHPENPLATLADPQARRHIAGVAWHCYAGEVGAQNAIGATYPQLESFMTECSGGDWAPNWGGTLGWMIDNLVIAPSRQGSGGTILWNLALDENHGPHLGGCGNCRGVVTIDSRTGTVTRNVEYYVLGHASRFVHPGARRIASLAQAPEIEQVAFRNPDGSLAILVHNRASNARRLAIRQSTDQLAVTLPAGEIATIVWPRPGSRH